MIILRLWQTLNNESDIWKDFATFEVFHDINNSKQNQTIIIHNLLFNDLNSLME